jgi:L-amino acid N-acyltransferase YncA
MITIKKAEINDAEEILDVKIRAFKEEVDLYGVCPPKYDSLENLINSISKCNYYKIVDDEKIIGGMSVQNKGNGHYWLGSIYIDSLYQNKGVGSLAMNYINKEYPNAIKWTLETPHKSYRNHHFYEKFGFVKIGEIKPYEDHTDFYLFQYENLITTNN